MKFKLYVHAQLRSYPTEGGSRFDFSCFSTDMSQYGYLLLGETEVEVPDYDEEALVIGQIRLMEEKTVAIQAKADEAIAAIRQEIGKLRALEAPKEAG